MLSRAVLLLIAAALSLPAADWNWNLSDGFPRPHVPADNAMNAAKVEMGRYLFYDKRMSVNGKQSCATCHRQELAFTDGKAHAKGTTGQLHPRGSMSLVNVAYAPRLTWVHPNLDSLEEQALVPMLGIDPIELGLKGHEPKFLSAIRRDPTYRRLFPDAFPGEAEITLSHVTKALSAFERSIVSMRSPYDRYRWGNDPSAMSESAKRGEIIFSSSERGGCFQCHGGWNFSAVRYAGGGAKDNGKLRAPTLRNISLTAPYMHDGSAPTLDDVINLYSAGAIRDELDHPRTTTPFKLTPTERRDLIAFLESLTDAELLRDPRWSDPWPSRR